MSEYRRWKIEGGAYFFTAVTNQRRPILTTALARRCLRESFHQAGFRRPFKVFAIVLLPDHLHTVWFLPRGDREYRIRWQKIKEGFTRRYLAYGGQEGSLTQSKRRRQERGVWQRRFWEHSIRDTEDLKRCVDYLHGNPVKHGLVSRVVDWPWSSFHRFVELGEYEATWGNSISIIDGEFGE